MRCGAPSLFVVPIAAVSSAQEQDAEENHGDGSCGDCDDERV
jgi:hypothetical protein